MDSSKPVIIETPLVNLSGALNKVVMKVRERFVKTRRYSRGDREVGVRVAGMHCKMEIV